MSFVVEDMEGFLRVLRENPEWRAAVRREILGDDFYDLPAAIARLEALSEENAVLIRQGAERLDRLEVLVRKSIERIDESAERIDRLDLLVQKSIERIDALEVLVQKSIERLDRLEVLVAQGNERLERLEIRVDRIDQRLTNLEETTQRIDTRLMRVEGQIGDIRGTVYEAKWREGYAGRFGRIIRRVRLVEPRELEMLEAADDQGTVSSEEISAVRELDLIVGGLMGRGDSVRDVLLAVEVSTNIERNDVVRAEARAATLRALGYDAVPVVAGERIDSRVREESDDRGVLVLLNVPATV